MQNFHYPILLPISNLSGKMAHLSPPGLKIMFFFPWAANRVSRLHLAFNVVGICTQRTLAWCQFHLLIWDFIMSVLLYLGFGFLVWKFKIPPAISNRSAAHFFSCPSIGLFRSPSVISAFSYIKGMFDLGRSAVHAWDAKVFALVYDPCLMEGWHDTINLALDLGIKVTQMVEMESLSGLYDPVACLWSFEEISFIYFDF